MKFFEDLTNKKLGKTRFHFRIYEDELRTLYALLSRVKAYTPKTPENTHYYGMIRNMHKVIGISLNKKKNYRTQEIGSNDIREIFKTLSEKEL